MTALNTSWSNIQKDLTTTKIEIVKGCTACAYSPKAQKFTFSRNCFGATIELIFEGMKSTAEKYAKQGVVNSKVDIAFPIDKIEPRVKECTLEICNGILHGADSTPQKKEEQKNDKAENSVTDKPSENRAVVRCGLQPDEQIACMKKVEEVVLQWFKEKSVLVNQRSIWMAPADKILDNTVRLDPELHNFFYKKFGLRRSKDPTTFSQQDFEAFGFKPGEKVQPPETLSCGQFALLKIREKRAKNYIFQVDLNTLDVQTKTLHTTLKSWGYTPVETPGSNDLVMYLDNAGVPQHLGRFLAKEGKVESKLGIKQPYFHWHDIFDVPPNYGTRVVFWRRPA